jgi:hypothetical protein
MAINFDHTNSAGITLKGPSNGQLGDNFTFVFPNVQGSDSNLLISGETSIGSISGLIDALAGKVEKSVTGNAVALNYGTNAGDLVQLNENGKIPDSFISSVAIRDVFNVTNFSDLTSTSAASIGDVGIVSSENKNYILCSSGTDAYATSSNWKEILFPVQPISTVNSLAGDVCLDGSNVCVTAGAGQSYAGYSIDYAINDLSVVKANLSDLIPYATTTFVTDCLANYPTTSCVSTTLSNYETQTQFSTTISDYATSSEVSGILQDYVLKSSTGSAASLNVGTSAGNVVQLNGDGKIEGNLLPSIAIADVFVVNNSGALIGLSSAHVGDIAVATGSHLNYILSGSDPANISNWVQFATNLGTVQSVNGVSPIDGAVTLTSSDIYVADTSTSYDEETVSYTVQHLNDAITAINNNYVTEDEATSYLSNYVTTGTATGIFNTKSDCGHVHAMSSVTDLTGCLSQITTFYTGAGAYSVTQFGSNPSFNEAYGDYSVALGYGAVANQDYEIAHASNYFSIPGDAQSSKIVSKHLTSNSTLTTVASISLQNYSNTLFSSCIVGMTTSSDKFATFKIEGAINRESNAASTTLLESVSKNTFVNSDSAYFADAVANQTDGTLDIVVSGDASLDMRWVVNTNVVKVIAD